MIRRDGRIQVWDYLRGSKRRSYMVINARILSESAYGFFRVERDELSILLRGSVDIGESIRRHVDQDGWLRLPGLPAAVLDVGAVWLEPPHLERQRIAE